MTHSHTQHEQVAASTVPDSHHVLFLIDRLHSTEGGAEGVVWKLCRFLPTRGFRCSVATFWAGAGVAQQFPCKVHIWPLRRTYDWTALENAFAFGRLLRSERIQIVHTFFPASDLWGGVVARLSGCPILVSSRRDMGILRSRKHQLAYRLANRLFDQVQAVSERVREFCISQDHLSPDRVVTVHNGIDLDAIDGALPGDRNVLLGADQDAPVVATVANIRSIKGIDILVEAAALVREQVPETVFVVIGAAIQEPDYCEAVRAAVSRLGLAQHLRFLGLRTDVISLLKQSDVFCLPSRSEGMSNALLEAMACRLPCVATDVGGNSEVVMEGQTGFLVPSENPHALAVRIVTLMRDRQRAKCMGQAGRRLVESKFTVQHMVERLGSLYDALLQQRGLISTQSGEQALWAIGQLPIQKHAARAGADASPLV
jgi:glycosyltransferase involved in cell wall biosynthesis